jgi:hypothetical protein
MNELDYSDVLNDTMKKPLLEHKYNGKDDSILYEKFISPLCQKIVDNYLPVTLAPNLITVVGFVIGLFPHMLIVLFDSPGTQVGGFLCVLQGICILIYSVDFIHPDL